MEQDQPIHSGFLQVPAAGKLLLRKSWQEKYCMLFEASKCGIKRLEIHDHADSTKTTSSKIISLQDCVKIVTENKTYFSITTTSAVYEFGAANVTSQKNWVSALQSVAFSDKSPKTNSITQKNEIYYSIVEDKFIVELITSPASSKCGLEEKQYVLFFTENCLELRDSYEETVIYSWPYRYIRKYGYRDGIFNFEAGRKCSSGEGSFYFQHSDEEEIFSCISSRIKSKVKNRPQEMLPIVKEVKSLKHVEISDTTKSKNAPNKPRRKNIPESEVNLTGKYEEVEFRNEAWKTMGIDDVTHTESDEIYSSWGPSPRKNTPQALVEAPKVITKQHIQEGYNKLNYFGSVNTLPTPYSTVEIANTSFNDIPSYHTYDEIEIEPVAKPKSETKSKNRKQVKQNSVKEKANQLQHYFVNGDGYADVCTLKKK